MAGSTTTALDLLDPLTGTKDFFLTKYNYSGAKQYTRQRGATASDTIAYSVATDASGNVYVVGSTLGNLDGNTLMSGLAGAFVTKFNSAGVKQFTDVVSDAGMIVATAVAVDPSGNVYVSGYTYTDIGTVLMTGTADLFLIKYDSSGVKQYTKLIGTSIQLGGRIPGTLSYAVATDASGNVYVAGLTQSDLRGNTRTGDIDFFVTKLNSSGAEQYTKQLGAASGTSSIAYGVTVDSDGNVYVAGETNGNLGRTRVGSTEFFLTKYNSTGTLQYTKQLGAAAFTTTVAKGVTVDANGNVYVAGYTTGDLDGNTRAGTNDYFLTKYSSAGVKQYTKQVGVTGKSTKGNSIAIDAIGNVYVAGQTTGGLDNNTTPSGTDFFVAKYNSAGVKQ